ncbi:phosphoribosylamine--glycine ligase [Paenibacillus sp. 598K]|uniref:phosphoribosylamine--glycine ligase n=1 Tax=Paenibacillus sp. 598K TaxID=1117987 RepID=UPI000FF916B9|nr:phosphoribosylamine--glycine ligase [Paenibacillus sp. 598K]GBF73630.1 phosphoribosylamine--glycine ligase [Paenibacillus sp. 598K]
MRLLVIGGGGREHALVWALKKSDKVKEIYCAPGNAGIAQLAECVPIPVSRFGDLIQFAVDHAIDLVVVGPDDPLAAGIVDAFEARGIPIFGPRQNAAEIEGSKIFMKDLLRKYNIPTAKYETFTDYESASAYLAQQTAPIVIKADGLAAGKGVTVARTMEEAKAALEDMMVGKVFGDSGSQVVIEECLEGQEMSILAFVDGETVRPMVPAQDHKPVYDGDLGPNTGGMGTYTPLPHIPQSIVDEAIENIIIPTAKAMVSEGRPFRGFLFAGLMITKNGPTTIEFNARMGDPETQVVLPRLKTDLLDIILAAMNGRLDQLEIEWSDEAAVCVILASEGYPASYPKGRVITGLAEAEAQEGIQLFHAGTSLDGDQFVTSGGRVLGVVGIGADTAQARERAYKAAETIKFDGVHYRTDIGVKALQGLNT